MSSEHVSGGIYIFVVDRPDPDWVRHKPATTVGLILPTSRATRPAIVNDDISDNIQLVGRRCGVYPKTARDVCGPVDSKSVK
jgi:hypothetical protein